MSQIFYLYLVDLQIFKLPSLITAEFMWQLDNGCHPLLVPLSTSFHWLRCNYGSLFCLLSILWKQAQTEPQKKTVNM